MNPKRFVLAILLMLALWGVALADGPKLPLSPPQTDWKGIRAEAAAREQAREYAAAVDLFCQAGLHAPADKRQEIFTRVAALAEAQFDRISPSSAAWTRLHTTARELLIRELPAEANQLLLTVERLILRDRQPGVVANHALVKTAQGVALRMLGKFAESVALLREVQSLSKDHPALSRAQNHFCLGETLYLAGNLDEARKELETGVQVLGPRPNEADPAAPAWRGVRGNLHQGMGLVLRALLRPRAARQELEQAAALRRSGQDLTTTILLADTLTALGALLRDDEGDLVLARRLLDEALGLRSRAGMPGQLRGLSLYQLGWLEYRAGDLELSRTRFEEALANQQLHVPNTAAERQTCLALSTLWVQLGNPVQARAYEARARRIPAAADPNVVLDLAIENARIAQSQGNLWDAADILWDACKQARGATAVARRRVVAHSNLATVLRALAEASELDPMETSVRQSVRRSPPLYGDQPKDLVENARKNIDDAEELLRQFSPHSPERANLLLQRALLMSRSFVEALQAEEPRLVLQHILETHRTVLSRCTPGSLGHAVWLGNQGAIEHLQSQRDTPGALDHAKQHLAAAADSIRRTAPGSLHLVPVLQNLALVHQTSARTVADPRERAIHWASAVAALREAWALVQRRGTMALGDTTRQDFGRVYRSTQMRLISALLDDAATDRKPDRPAAQEALEVLEQGRAQALMQMLLLRDHSRRPEARDAWKRAREAGVHRMLVERRMVEGEDRKTQDDAQGEYPTARADEDARLAELYLTLPPGTTATGELQHSLQALRDGDLVLAFSTERAFLDDPFRLFVITKTNGQAEVRAFAIGGGSGRPTRTQLLARVGGFSKLVSTPPPTLKSERERAARTAHIAKLGNTLSHDLFTCFAASPLLERCRRVIVVPDLGFWGLPFAALPMHDRGGGPLLGLTKPMITAPSLALLARWQQMPVQKGRIRMMLTEDPERRGAFRPGPLFPAELRDLYGQDLTVLSGRQATEEAMVAQLQNARRAAFFGHAGVQREWSEGSTLLLAEPDEPGHAPDPARDGFLQAWEVTRLDLRHLELMLLWSCSSGAGTEVPAEGITGLARAFLLAGARGVVGALWPVVSGDAASFARDYHRLLEQHTPDNALLVARRSAARATPDPYGWSAWVFLGAPGAVSPPP